MDTIYALSTAQGKAGVAIIRVSGPQAFAAAQQLCGSPPPAHHAVLRQIRDTTGGVIDEGLVLTFPEKRSFTGEDVVEFQIHGSVAVIRALLGALSCIDGLRMADAGEFTRRALENGRLDLAQVEGLADLIEAETEAQRVQAARLLSGDLGRMAEAWRGSLIRAVALLEATIDFADEDVPVDVSPEVTHLVTAVRDGLTQQVSGVQAAERVRTGFEVAIVGAPNVGKSTLLNRLAGRDAAITSEIAGTTRDVIEVRMDLGGLAVTLLDTAGLREADDAVERIGVERARSRAAQADLRVYLLSGANRPDPEPLPGDIVLRAKGDLLGDEPDVVSGKTGLGVSALVERITQTLGDRAANAGLATHERHRQAMLRGVSALDSALGSIAQGEAMAEIAAEELHIAIRALDSLVGRIDIENVLDEIFASFCVGK